MCQFLLIIFLNLVVNLTAVDVYSAQLSKSCCENVEQESEAKSGSDFETKKLFTNVQEWLIATNTTDLAPVIFHHRQTIFPTHHSSPLIKPPIFSV